MACAAVDSSDASREDAPKAVASRQGPGPERGAAGLGQSAPSRSASRSCAAPQPRIFGGVHQHHRGARGWRRWLDSVWWCVKRATRRLTLAVRNLLSRGKVALHLRRAVICRPIAPPFLASSAARGRLTLPWCSQPELNRTGVERGGKRGYRSGARGLSAGDCSHVPSSMHRAPRAQARCGIPQNASSPGSACPP